LDTKVKGFYSVLSEVSVFSKGYFP
jgi:hypothetical protein